MTSAITAWARRTNLWALALIALTTIVVAASVTTRAAATHQPADKVVAAGSTVQVFGPAEQVVLLDATLKTSKPTDLILAVSLECAIFTELTTGAMGQTTDEATAEGKIRIWVEIDGQIVPINSMSEPSQPTPPGGSDSDKVTFCNREYHRSVTDREGDDSQDEIKDFIRTKNANAFNWLRLNLGNGAHQIVVKGELTVNTMNTATAEAFVGNRSLIVEPAKLANDATI